MTDAATKETTLAVGLDVGDRYVQVCVLDEAGEVVEESRLLRPGLAPVLQAISELTLEIRTLSEAEESQEPNPGERRLRGRTGTLPGLP
jgi:predicted NBD/HSP70 family sugar kinase